MNKKIIGLSIGIIYFSSSFMNPLFHEQVPRSPAPVKKVKKISKKPLEKATHPVQHQLKKGIIKNTASQLSLMEVSFDELPGWSEADLKKSLETFQASCKHFLKQKPSHPVGSQHIKLKAGDWHPACKEAVKLETESAEVARSFFKTWFHPIEFSVKKPVSGLFTGYYLPRLKGRLNQSAQFNTPIYGVPKTAQNYTRAQIDKGVLKHKAPVIAWINSPVERLFLEMEGAGVIQLPNGKNLYLGYAGENGAPFRSMGQLLIDKGLMSRDNASKKAIVRYLEQHPDKASHLLHQNKSFVFFEHLKKPMALGAQGMALTPGYSLAVDKKWIPLGAPLWLNTSKPDKKQHKEKPLRRLMIAQDTGGAIHGFMRGDIYWGTGKLAAFLGEHMKNKGHYWLLLPKNIFA